MRGHFARFETAKPVLGRAEERQVGLLHADPGRIDALQNQLPNYRRNLIREWVVVVDVRDLFKQPRVDGSMQYISNDIADLPAA